jgi:hypothetical protein
MGDHHEGIKGSIDGGDLNLPPGFRFHPSDEEIITFYLIPKVMDSNFTTLAIGDLNINNSEPWELPSKHSYYYIPHSLCLCVSLIL